MIYEVFFYTLVIYKITLCRPQSSVMRNNIERYLLHHDFFSGWFFLSYTWHRHQMGKRTWNLLERPTNILYGDSVLGTALVRTNCCLPLSVDRRYKYLVLGQQMPLFVCSKIYWGIRWYDTKWTYLNMLRRLHKVASLDISVGCLPNKKRKATIIIFCVLIIFT